MKWAKRANHAGFAMSLTELTGEGARGAGDAGTGPRECTSPALRCSRASGSAVRDRLSVQHGALAPCVASHMLDTGTRWHPEQAGSLPSLSLHSPGAGGGGVSGRNTNVNSFKQAFSEHGKNMKRIKPGDGKASSWGGRWPWRRPRESRFEDHQSLD